jgi:hypothetical protein
MHVQCLLSVVTSVVLNVYLGMLQRSFAMNVHGMLQHSFAVTVLFPDTCFILKFLFYTSVRFQVHSWGVNIGTGLLGCDIVQAAVSSQILATISQA